MSYYRPLAQTGAIRPDGAIGIAGGWSWFTHAVRLDRATQPVVVPASELPAQTLDALSRPRSDIAGLSMSAPRIMAILNATPDSFSDGGLHADPAAAARDLIKSGADIVDVGGESTRPGATEVPGGEEIARVLPAIRAARSGWDGPISIDTRKADVARAAMGAGATMLNDVSALTYDPDMGRAVAESGVPVCLMHAQGDPATMQAAPRYDDVLLDIYDWLARRIAVAVDDGIARDRIVLDPGIGFGKTLDHNLTLLRNLSLFHGLGCPILLGASRKRFIGTLTDTPDAAGRAPGSIAVALAAVAQGVQILRVHDMAATRQALTLWRAVTEETP